MFWFVEVPTTQQQVVRLHKKVSLLGYDFPNLAGTVIETKCIVRRHEAEFSKTGEGFDLLRHTLGVASVLQCGTVVSRVHRVCGKGGKNPDLQLGGRLRGQGLTWLVRDFWRKEIRIAWAATWILTRAGFYFG